ncbi:MAG: enamine deaminase RidA [Gammaproteobacteria bacterium]|nr:MAG: enamine deaminase RidA [Gammaproteobacteria bacterium]
MGNRTVLPEGWHRPKGYSNAVIAQGRQIYVAGQVGWDSEERFNSDDIAEQAAQALRNIVAVLEAAGAGPEDIVRMTWYVTDKAAYIAGLKEIGQAYREIIGRNFPAMTAVEVTALIEDRAKVEVECTAVVDEDSG